MFNCKKWLSGVIMSTYVILKYSSAAALMLGALIIAIVGRKRQSPFYGLWVAFLFVYGVFDVFDALEYSYNVLWLYRALQAMQALAIIFLFAACLEQAMILSSKASRILAISLYMLALYSIVIPLDSMIQLYKDVSIRIYSVIPSDIYGLIYGLFVLVSAFLLAPIFIRYVRSASITNDKRLKNKRNITLLLIIMLIGFGGLVIVRREMIKELTDSYLLSFILIDNLYTVAVIITVAFYLAQSISHGIQTILVVDKEGNPLVGYSPLARTKIDYEEKIIAASGYLSGIFHFVHDYIASSKDEQFKELKTTSSSLNFYAGEKVFMILQTKISSKRLERTSSDVLKALDNYLEDLKPNIMPNQEQLDHIISLLDNNFYLLA